MTMNGLEVKSLTLGLLNSETERDRQRKVGASQISDPCDKHLAKALSGEPQQPSKYWLGGKMGTATHLLLESFIPESKDEDLAGAVVEKKIVLGELENYGTINSKPDLYLPARSHLIDWKTATRDKTRKLRKFLDGETKDASSEYTLKKYIGQTQLYAWGLNNAGMEVENISLVFINRDGTNEADIWEHTFPYQEDLAIGLWDRLTWIWDKLTEGEHPDNFSGEDGCFLCTTGK